MHCTLRGWVFQTPPFPYSKKPVIHVSFIIKYATLLNTNLISCIRSLYSACAKYMIFLLRRLEYSFGKVKTKLSQWKLCHGWSIRLLCLITWTVEVIIGRCRIWRAKTSLNKSGLGYVIMDIGIKRPVQQDELRVCKAKRSTELIIFIDKIVLMQSQYLNGEYTGVL